MPVRRPRVRRNKKKAKKSKVKHLRTPDSWDRALVSSDRRYLVLHVYQGSSRGSFSSSFANMASLKHLKHMVFAECNVDAFPDVRATVTDIRGAQFPMLLVWHKRECIKHCAPPPPRQQAGGMFMGMGRTPNMYAFPTTAMRFLEDLAPEAPRPKPITVIAVAVSTLVLGVGGTLLARRLGWGKPPDPPMGEDLYDPARGEVLLPDGRRLAELDPPEGFEWEIDEIQPREPPIEGPEKYVPPPEGTDYRGRSLAK